MRMKEFFCEITVQKDEMYYKIDCLAMFTHQIIEQILNDGGMVVNKRYYEKYINICEW